MKVEVVREDVIITLIKEDAKFLKMITCVAPHVAREVSKSVTTDEDNQREPIRKALDNFLRSLLLRLDEKGVYTGL